MTGKLLLPSALIALVCLICAAILFLAGCRWMQTSLLWQRTNAEAERVIGTLEKRVLAVSEAAMVLAADPDVITGVREDTDLASGMRNAAALAARDRFDLSLVQIHDRDGVLQTDLRQPLGGAEDGEMSSLVNIAEPDAVVLRNVGGDLLLLGRSPVAGEAGTVVVGTGLTTEL